MTISTNSNAGQKARRKHSKDFKKQAVGLARQPDVGFRKAANDLGINESLLRAWDRLFAAEGPEAFRGHGVRTEVEAELARLKRENAVLREERDILKKATEFFVKERR